MPHFRGSEKPRFFKKPKSPTHWVFWGFYWVLGFIGFSDFLFERAAGKRIG